MSGDMPAMPDEAELVRAELQCVLQSPPFAASQRLQEFLTFVVEETLAGRARELKEHTIAVMVYMRPSDFDPKLDSIVRTEARRLRQRLKESYAQRGDNGLRIDLPVGRYVAQFTMPAAAVPSGVEALASPETGPTVVRAVASPALGQPTAYAPARSAIVSRRTLFAALASAVGIGGVALFVSRRTPGADRVGVLIVPFTYDPGSDLQDGSVESAIEFTLAGSRVVHVIPRVRVEDALRLLKLSADSKLTPTLASGVAARDAGIDVVLTGRVALVRSQWTVSLWLREATGRALASTTEALATADDAPATAAALAGWVRVSVRDSDLDRQPMEPVATRSLAALRLYTNGVTSVDRGNWVAAESAFRDALVLDPRFASAHIFHAWALRTLAVPNSEVLATAARAESFAAEASERERLFIRASARHLEGRIDEAYSLYARLLELYPDDRWALQNLSAYTSGIQANLLSDYWRSYAESRPNHPDTALQVARWFTINGRDPSGAAPYIRRARALADGPDTQCLLDWLAAFGPWVEGNELPWLAAAERASKTPITSRHSVSLGLLLVGAGKPSVAREVLHAGGDPVGINRWSAIAARTRGASGAELVASAVEALVDTRPNALTSILLSWGGRHDAAQRMAEERRRSVVSGARQVDIEACWAVAEEERRVTLSPAERPGAALERARAHLEGMRYPEYFVAAHRIADSALARGDGARARRVLQSAVSQRAAAYPEATVFWVGCLERLARLERDTQPAGFTDTRWSDMLTRTLGASEPGFEPAGLFRQNPPVS